MREVVFYPSAEKFIRKIKEKPLKLKIKDAIDKICENPYVGTAKKGDLAGIWCYDVYYNTNIPIKPLQMVLLGRFSFGKSTVAKPRILVLHGSSQIRRRRISTDFVGGD